MEENKLKRIREFLSKARNGADTHSAYTNSFLSMIIQDFYGDVLSPKPEVNKPKDPPKWNVGDDLPRMDYSNYETVDNKFTEVFVVINLFGKENCIEGIFNSLVKAEELFNELLGKTTPRVVIEKIKVPSNWIK